MRIVRQRAAARVWLLFAGLGLGLLIAGLIFSGFSANRKLVREIEQDSAVIESSKRLARWTMESHLADLERELLRLAKLADLKEAVIRRDRESLLEQVRPPLNRLGKGPLQVSRINFYAPTGALYLSAHDPDSFDGHISNRRLVAEAISARKIFKGLEVENGVPCLWVTAPLYHDGQFLGILEVGSSLSPVVKAMTLATGGEVAVLAGHGAPRVAESSDPALFSKVVPRLHLQEGVSPEIRQVVAVQEKTFAATLVSLKDFSGRPVAALAILVDATAITDILRQSHLVTLVISVVGFALTALLLTVLTRRLDRFYGDLEARVAERTRELATLQEVGTTLTSSLDLPAVLELIGDSAIGLLGAQRCAVFVLDPNDQRLHARMTRGMRSDQPYIPLKLGQGAAGSAALSRRPFFSPDVLRQPAPGYDDRWDETGITLHEVVRRRGYRAILAVPVVSKDAVFGAICIYWDEVRSYDEGEVRLLTALAQQAAVAIENAHLYEKAQARLSELKRLTQLGHLVTSSLDLQRVLDVVTEAAVGLVKGDLGRIWVVDEKASMLRLRACKAPHGEAAPVGHSTEFPLGQGLVGWVVEHKTKRYSPNLLEEPLQVNKKRVEGYVSQITVPLLGSERALGALVILTKVPRQFSQEEEGLLELFAGNAATALESARLFREIQQAYEELARTRDQLTQAQKMEAIGRLAGGVAHDFNNLLTVMTGRCQLTLARLRPDDPVCRDIELIRKTADRAAALTRQLLAFSRKQMLQPKVLDLNAVVKDMHAMLRRLIGEDIDLVIAPGSGLGRIKADPGQLEQVIVNLVINSRDAMPQGGRLVLETASVELDDAFVWQHPGARPGPHVMLAVSDTGCGMDAKTQAHLFEPFFTTKEKGKGTGLGLSTVYGIVKQHDGYISVESEPGRGSTFKIYLPRVQDAAERVAGGPSVTEPRRGTETVLLVEDEEEVRALTWEVLRESGYRVLEAANGDDALLTSERHAGPIHLLLTDVVMPLMSGPELAQRLAPLRQEMKVLYMSGYTEEALGHHGVLDPGIKLLSKPFTPTDLAQKVREVLDSPRGEAVVL